MVIKYYKKQKKIKTIKSDINEIVKRSNKSEEQKCTIKNIKTLYES